MFHISFAFMPEILYDNIVIYYGRKSVAGRVNGVRSIPEKGCRILLEGGTGEIVEKKSRFIATARKVESEEEAAAFIEEMKKKYWDARHNCSAFVIGRRGELTRCSDDGEPSGTAGRPMLEVLLGEGIRNVAVVVTRYFGGTLLGTGGLVRAYTQAVKAALERCVIGVERPGQEIQITANYTDLGRIQYLLGQKGITPLSSEYTDQVRLVLLIPAETNDELRRELTEATGGRVVWEKRDEYYFVDKESSNG